MKLETIKDLLVIDADVDAVVSSDDFSYYDSLAQYGYEPAKKLAPIAKGYQPIDEQALRKRLESLGETVEPEVVENIKRWERKQGWDMEEWEHSDQRSYYEVISAIRANPITKRPTKISILGTDLSNYGKVIPPESAKSIATAIESNLFSKIEVWYPNEVIYPDEALEYTAARHRLKQPAMLDDPVAIGIVSGVYYFICFWPTDVMLKGAAKCLEN
jgi:hypothetical protein